MLGIKLGGDPQSARELAAWLRDDVAAQADAAEATAKWARNQLGEDGSIWWDMAAELTWDQLDAGARKAAAYADKVRRFAQLLDDSADQLCYAQELLAEVPQLAEYAKLEHTDEYVAPPDPKDDISEHFRGDPASISDAERTSIFSSRMGYYRRCEELVEQAAQVIIDQMEKLARANEFDWVPVHFAAGAFVSDETVEVAKWYQSSKLTEVGYFGRWGVFWAEQAGQSGEVSPLQDALLRNASDDATKVNKYASHARAGGIVMRVLKPVGPLLNVAGVIYDIRSGYTARRAIFTSVAGIGAGALAAVGIAALLTPPGWVVVAASAITGFVVSQFVAPDVYDQYIMTPRERLLHVPNAPDLDPGPTKLTDS